MINKHEAMTIVHNLLHCKTCKGKGIVYNPRGKDKKCECRKAAAAWLRENE